MRLWFEVVLAASGATDQGVLGACSPFHGCLHYNSGGRVRLWRLEVVSLKEQTSVVNTVYHRRTV
jgi:hypothetical protein